MSTTSPSLAAQAIAAFARGGVHLDESAVLDIHLAEIADKAACSLLRDQWKNDFPVAAYTELLSAVAALRDVLGFAPSQTAVEVFDWVRRQREESARALTSPYQPYPVSFLDGPYRGVEMLLEGPSVGQHAGPPYFTPLPIVWGDTERLGHTSVRYKRGDDPSPEGVWPYRLRTDDPSPPEGSRPYLSGLAAREEQ
ncbi:hypothetical protein [Streptomyces sp. NPDC046685]|uniref:hypothetical protein n=1 Tax=Streptomyces sp. NPDC046685 TaxID=3157202 RepID=UPI0033F351CA